MNTAKAVMLMRDRKRGRTGFCTLETPGLCVMSHEAFTVDLASAIAALD